MSKRWKTSTSTVYNVCYHIIWCPKYRRKVLEGDVEIRLKELLHDKAEELEVEIEEMEVMPDHLHLFVNASPALAPHHIVQQFKGLTSRRLREEFPSLKSRLPSLWTRSYYMETIGHISEDTIRQYIKDQKNH
jgi:putative transposase